MNVVIHTFWNLSSSMYIQRGAIYHLRGIVAQNYWFTNLPHRGAEGAAVLRGMYVKMLS